MAGYPSFQPEAFQRARKEITNLKKMEEEFLKLLEKRSSSLPHPPHPSGLQSFMEQIEFCSKECNKTVTNVCLPTARYFLKTMKHIVEAQKVVIPQTNKFVNPPKRTRLAFM
jgi:hypothetical protein